MHPVVWIERSGRSYNLILADGYLAPPNPIVHLAGSRNIPLEQAVAECLYEMAKHSAHVGGGEPPSPLHVWIAGSSGWLGSSLARCARTLAEGDRHPDYRIVVIGAGVAKVSPADLDDWDIRLNRVGMRLKEHELPIRYGMTGTLLLGRMYREYRRTDRPPTSVLVENQMPVAFCGDY